MTTSNGRSGTGGTQEQEARRLKELWDRCTRKPSQVEFGEMYGIGGQSAVANFLHGRSPLSLKAALGFARGLGVQLEDFSPRLAAEVQTISSAARDVSTKATDPNFLARRRPTFSPPLLGEIRKSGDGLEQVLYTDLTRPKGLLELWTIDSSDAFAMRVKGDALFPRYRAGEFLILSKRTPPVQGADVLVQIELGPLMMKQWNWAKDGEIQLLPINGEGQPLTVDETDVAWLDRVLGVASADLFVSPSQ